MTFLVEQGLSAKEIAFLYNKHPNAIYNNFRLIQEHLSDGGSYLDLLAVLEGRPTMSGLMSF